MHALRAGENAIRSWLTSRMVMFPRKQRGRETETSPSLASISMSRFGCVPLLVSGQCYFFFCAREVSVSTHTLSFERRWAFGKSDAPLLLGWILIDW